MISKTNFNPREGRGSPLPSTTDALGIHTMNTYEIYSLCHTYPAMLARWARHSLDRDSHGFSIRLSLASAPTTGYVVGGYSHEYPLAHAHMIAPSLDPLENAINAALWDLRASVTTRYYNDFELTPAQRRLRRLPLHDFVIGGWRESVDSPLIIEVSRIWKSLDHAYADGMERGQKAIYDVEHNHVITLPNRGD